MVFSFAKPVKISAQKPAPRHTCSSCTTKYAECLKLTTDSVCKPLFEECKRRYCKADGTDFDETLLGSGGGIGEFAMDIEQPQDDSWYDWLVGLGDGLLY